MNLSSYLFLKKKGKFARNIFEECGFDGDVLGRERIRAASRRWQEAYRDKGLSGLCDTRNGSSGRPRCRELTLEDIQTKELIIHILVFKSL
jgi:hypothetical protein